MLEKIEVLDSKVLVKPILDEEEVTKTGIIVAPSTKNQYTKGEVVKIGNGYISNGLRFKLELIAGDIVIFEKYDCKDVNIDGDNYKLIDYSDILYLIKK